tara:strand:- start:3512 stop:3733 length:222 start_codon:yes stop_codon:yes gene_type:complete
MCESYLFAHWLGKQGKANLLTCKAVNNVMDRLRPADLIFLLYSGDAQQSAKALTLLKDSFENEMHFLHERSGQ